jgi:four helix bundle protein
MNEQEFKYRTKNLALRTIRLVESLPLNISANTLGKQLLRSATSVSANYRAACRAKSIPDMINKLAIVEEEANERLYCLELLIEAELVKEAKLVELKKDFNEIVAMVVSSIKILRLKNPKSKIANPKSTHENMDIS